MLGARPGSSARAARVVPPGWLEEEDEIDPSPSSFLRRAWNSFGLASVAAQPSQSRARPPLR